MIINHNCCIKLVPLVTLVNFALVQATKAHGGGSSYIALILP